jgi:hypothetical protein
MLRARLVGLVVAGAATAPLAACATSHETAVYPPMPNVTGATETTAARALATLQRGCSLGDADACADIGVLLLDGAEGIERNVPAALGMLDAACAHGSPRGCRHLGEVLVVGVDGQRPETARAVALFERACQRENAAGCRDLGEMYARGLGVGRDPSRAEALWDRACRWGDGRACDDLGSALLASGAEGEGLPSRQRGVTPVAAHAASLYERACDLESAAGCGHLGAALFTGTGRPRDVAQGVSRGRRRVELRSRRSHPGARRGGRAGSHRRGALLAALVRRRRRAGLRARGIGPRLPGRREADVPGAGRPGNRRALAVGGLKRARRRPGGRRTIARDWGMGARSWRGAITASPIGRASRAGRCAG